MTGFTKAAPKNNAFDKSFITTKKIADTLDKKISSAAIFPFFSELCDNKGYYDPKKYSVKELEGTHSLWFGNTEAALTAPSLYRPEDLDLVRKDNKQILARFDKDYAIAKKNLQSLTVVNSPYWQNLKKLNIKELDQEYEKEKVMFESFVNPKILLNNRYSKSCGNFANALNGSDENLKAEWRKLREQMSKRNSDPQRIMKEFENRMQSADWKKYAILDLTVYGWGNCANELIERPVHDEKMSKEFESLFIKIDAECDEP